MSKKPIYKAVIIGAGKIASGYDTPKSKTILTHAHALVNEPRVEFVAISDTDAARGAFEAKKWDVSYFTDTEVMLNMVQPDIIVIATPSETHKDVLLAAMKHQPKAIIVEKPVVNERREIAVVRVAAKKYKVPVIVNFRRRFDVTTSGIRDALIRGNYGSVLSASAMYSKGVLHNGSHMVDLARYLFGEMTSAKMSFCTDDFPEGEPTLGGVATFERCPQFYLMSGDERSFYIFELTVVTERYRIRFIEEGRNVTVEEVVRDTVYKDDYVLGKMKSQKTELEHAMPHMIAHAVRVADGTEAPHSSIEEALKTQETCYRLSASFTKK